jgi:hypothetical protein
MRRREEFCQMAEAERQWDAYFPERFTSASRKLHDPPL